MPGDSPVRQFATDLALAFEMELKDRNLTLAEYRRLPPQRQNGLMASAMNNHMPKLLAARTGSSEEEIRDLKRRLAETQRGGGNPSHLG